MSTEEFFIRSLQGVKDNDPRARILEGSGVDAVVQNLTDEEWEEIGRDISKNAYLEWIQLFGGALNDHKMSLLFRGLTGSSSMEQMLLSYNDFKAAGVQSMVPFLQNATNLRQLQLNSNIIQSAGFNVLLRALSVSPIEYLSCIECGIESIEIDNYFPRNLARLDLTGNEINTDGCQGIAQLLQAGDSTLVDLGLDDNNINDEGVAVLADALKRNTSLTTLSMRCNDGISKEGLVMLLKLVNDISSVEATLQSNHNIICIDLSTHEEQSDADEYSILRSMQLSTMINRNNVSNSEAAGRQKVIETQLRSVVRAALAEFQGVNLSLYSGINNLHLPEVLSFAGSCHGHSELYVALKLSILELISTVNRKECIRQRRAYHAGIVEELDAELAEIEAAEGNAAEAESEYDRIKRRRV